VRQVWAADEGCKLLLHKLPLLCVADGVCVAPSSVQQCVLRGDLSTEAADKSTARQSFTSLDGRLCHSACADRVWLVV
jgi:hypothetical protein